MSELKVGTIHTAAANGKAFRLEEDMDAGIEDRWYSVFRSGQMANAKVGDKVEFEYNEKSSGGRTFYNVSGSVKVTSAAPVTAVASTGQTDHSSSVVGFPLSSSHKDRAITRRHAVSTAVELLAVNRTEPLTIEEVVQVAKDIAYYTTGDEDKDNAKVMVDADPK